jgi:hypothetical protein
MRLGHLLAKTLTDRSITPTSTVGRNGIEPHVENRKNSRTR